MSEMVDRVARAQAGARWDSFDEEHRSAACDLVRIAIAAMREPTEAMAQVGRRGPNGEYSWDHDALTVWHDMIDEALRAP